MSATGTSVAAFHSSGRLIGREQLRVLRLLREWGPGTAKEIAQRSGESIVLQKRMPELVEMGLAFRLEARRCAVSGHSATVWQAKDSTLRVAADSPLPGHSGPVKPTGPSFTGERRYRDESPRSTASLAEDFRCPCGRASAATLCPDGCGAVFCDAHGHAKHECGGGHG